MKEVTCDICGKKLGTEHTVGISYYSKEPKFRDFMIDVNTLGVHQIDICRDCENEFVVAVHAVYEKLKVKK